MSRTIKSILLLLTSLSVASDPIDTVNTFNAGLVDTLKLDSYQRRVEQLESVVAEHFDIETLSRIALGRHWRSLDTAEQKQVSTLMRKVVASSYASRFPLYQDEYFEVVAESSVGSSRHTIKTVLHSNKKEVAMDYQLIHVADRFLIYDIVAEGVSDLALKRSMYSALLSTEGLPGLLALLEKTISDNASNAAINP